MQSTSASVTAWQATAREGTAAFSLLAAAQQPQGAGSGAAAAGSIGVLAAATAAAAASEAVHALLMDLTRNDTGSGGGATLSGMLASASDAYRAPRGRPCVAGLVAHVAGVDTRLVNTSRWQVPLANGSSTAVRCACWCLPACLDRWDGGGCICVCA